MASIKVHALTTLRKRGIAAKKVLYVDAEGERDQIWYISNAGHQMHVEVWVVKVEDRYRVKTGKPELGLPL